MRVLSLALLTLAAEALVPTHPRAMTMSMNGEVQSRRNFGASLLAGVVGAGMAKEAQATAGEGPTFSLFGIIGAKESMSEGAAYGSDQSDPVYSPYSPYGSIRDESLAVKTGSITDTALYKRKLAESTKRLNKVPAYIAKKEWYNVKDELTRQMYDLRKSMNGLATTTESKAVAVQFYKEIEALDLACTQKNQAAATANYEAAKASLAKYSSLI